MKLLIYQMEATQLLIFKTVFCGLLKNTKLILNQAKNDHLNLSKQNRKQDIY